MAELSPLTENLIKDYQNWHESLTPKEGVPLLSVDEITSRLAFFYEKIKSVIDWHEEHLLRKAAIERILKRRIVFQKESGGLTESLVLELIRGGYFENNKIEESKLPEVRRALEKYSYIIANAQHTPKKKEISRWLIGLAACELEEILDPPLKQKALIDYMVQSMASEIEVPPEAADRYKLSEKEKYVQIYIACQKSLFKFDNTLIGYRLIRLLYPDWEELGESRLKDITENIYSVWNGIKKEFRHPAAHRFYNVCKRRAAPYLILGDIISEDPSKAEALIKNSEEFEKTIGAAYDSREKIIRKRVRRAAIYATLSIFISKILIVLALEIPFDRYVAGKFSYFSLIINVIIPPLLMFLLIVSIKSPGADNRQQVVLDTIKIAYRREKPERFLIKAPKKRGVAATFFVYLFYILMFLLSFGVIIWILDKIHFSVFSQIIFIFFVCLISFAGVKIRDRARELEVIEKKEGILNFVIDILSMPFIKMGRWLAEQLSKYNAILVFLNVLIDAPFQVFLEFLEKWRAFLKEKKAENI